MSLNANILGALDQIGLLEELEAISFPVGVAKIMYDNMNITASFDNANKNDE